MTINSAALRSLIKAQASTSDEADSFFTDLFLLMLNREPYPVEIDFLVGKIASGASYASALQSFTRLEAFESSFPWFNEAIVTAIYERVLSRLPEQDGLDFWSNALQTQSIVQIALDIVQSNEFSTNFPSADKAITQFYQAFLDRQPDEAGLAYWAEMLQSGTSTTKVLQSFLQTPEALSKLLFVAGSALTGESSEVPVSDDTPGVSINGGSGDDTLEGGAGNDTIGGGDGNDLITGQAGDDLLQGAEDNDTIYGSAGNDTIYGGEGSDYLYGEDGWNTLTGRTEGDNFIITGNDWITDLANGSGDVVKVEATGEANADLYASWTANAYSYNNGIITIYTNGFNVNLSAINTGANGWNISHGNNSGVASSTAGYLTGSTLSDVINGGNGADIINGGWGNDTLIGGDGSDDFKFSSDLDASLNVDAVIDFSGGDQIYLAKSVFTNLTGSYLSDSNFAANSTGVATNATSYIVYNTSTGSLAYDADGNGSEAAIIFATLVGAPLLSAVQIVAYD